MLLLRNGETYLHQTATLSHVLNYHTSQLLAIIYPVTCFRMILIVIIMYGNYVLWAMLLESHLVLRL
ncbi:hypothetical protein NC653_033970 [Populus alba x Populus x berolinensis]|uniref:Uncharacterized protein n=1 Tax=Populus alba x Populus x berolinensis TaxID=444605 RepID=A0AAD6LVB2_9ROSI|nr:hypothetical protein NC653_033970 [Populus alba x Populus x berolinensis]